MILRYLSAVWAAVAVGLGNHLWQSTLFLAVAGLLTLNLRKNRARTRYWLWLTASVKFLAPFSLLVGMGNHLGWLRASTGTKRGLYFAMEEVSQPFTQSAVAMIPRSVHTPGFAGWIHLLPAVLAAMWLCGLVVVVAIWAARWRRVSTVAREAAPLREGREVEALRRLESLGIGGLRPPIEMVASCNLLEPGVFGIIRPVLVWPEGISERLQDAQMEAILAHELWHVRRRDNLAAATHMLVEAIFWFHPAVWWLGARLVEEREQACDEEVLELGSDRQVYAESILKICEFCIGSPLACVSGVTGADLKKRMVRIMSENVARRLDFSRKLLLIVAGVLAVAVPFGIGLLHATPSRAAAQASNAPAATPGYDNVSITKDQTTTEVLETHKGVVHLKMMLNLGSVTSSGGTLKTFIQSALGVQSFQIFGGPKWINSEAYNIETTVSPAVQDQLRSLDPDQREKEQQRMLQTLLADRFKLIVHREAKQLPESSFVIAEDGAKLQETTSGDPRFPPEIKLPDGSLVPVLPGQQLFLVNRIVGRALGMTNLATILSDLLGHVVLDKTGLTGKYDWDVQWGPATLSNSGPSGEEKDAAGMNNVPLSGSSQPPIVSAIQDQLGLKLETQTGPVDILVIDHAEEPAEN